MAVPRPRPFLIPHPAFCLPVHVHNADRLHCYRLAGPLEEGAITIPNPIPLIMIPRSALPRLPNTKPPIVLAPPACSIRSWDNRGVSVAIPSPISPYGGVSCDVFPAFRLSCCCPVRRRLPLAEPRKRGFPATKSPPTTASSRSIKGMSDLTHLDLGESRVTDAGIKHLGALSRISVLNLSGTAVSDASVETLVQRKDLTELDLNKTRVTDGGSRG